MLGKYAVVVAQLVSASGCGPEGRRFESGLPPHSLIRRRRAYGAASFFVLENKFSHKKECLAALRSGRPVAARAPPGLGEWLPCAARCLRISAAQARRLRAVWPSASPPLCSRNCIAARASLGRKEMLAFALLRLAGPIARAPLGLPPPQGPTSPTGRSCKKTLAAGAPPVGLVGQVRLVRQKHSPQGGPKKSLQFCEGGAIFGPVVPFRSPDAASRKSE